MRSLTVSILTPEANAPSYTLNMHSSAFSSISAHCFISFALPLALIVVLCIIKNVLRGIITRSQQSAIAEADDAASPSI